LSADRFSSSDGRFFCHVVVFYTFAVVSFEKFFRIVEKEKYTRLCNLNQPITDCIRTRVCSTLSCTLHHGISLSFQDPTPFVLTNYLLFSLDSLGDEWELYATFSDAQLHSWNFASFMSNIIYILLILDKRLSCIQAANVLLLLPLPMPLPLPSFLWFFWLPCWCWIDIGSWMCGYLGKFGIGLSSDSTNVAHNDHPCMLISVSLVVFFRTIVLHLVHDWGTR
jgi:hypothetical protein